VKLLKVQEPGGAMRQRLAHHATRRKAEAQGIDYDAKMDEWWAQFEADMNDPESVAYKMMAMPGEYRHQL